MKKILTVFSLCHFVFGLHLSVKEPEEKNTLTSVTGTNDTDLTTDYFLSLLKNSNKSMPVQPKLKKITENITDDKILQEFDSKKDNKVDERSFLLIKSQKRRWPKVHHLRHNTDTGGSLVQLKPYRNYIDALASAMSPAAYFFRHPKKQNSRASPKFNLHIDDPFKDTHHANEVQQKSGNNEKSNYDEINSQHELLHSANQYAPVPIVLPTNEHTRKYLLNSKSNSHQHSPSNCLRYTIYSPNMENAYYRPPLREPTLPKKREDLELSMDKGATENLDDIDLLNNYLNSAIESHEVLDKDPIKHKLDSKQKCDCRHANTDEISWISKRDDKDSQSYSTNQSANPESNVKNHFYDNAENEGYQGNTNSDDAITSPILQNSNQTLFKINYA